MTGSACSSPSSCRTPWPTSSRAGASGISTRGRRPATLSHHARFLGHTPRRELDPIVHLLREEAARDRSVRARARALRGDALRRNGRPRRSQRPCDRPRRAAARPPRTARSYAPEQRPWLPHVTVLRFRARPKLEPPLPDLGAFAPSGALLSFHVCTRQGHATRSWNCVTLKQRRPRSGRLGIFGDGAGRLTQGMR